VILSIKDFRLKEIRIGKLPKRIDLLVGKKLRKVLLFLEAAADTRDIRAYKALHYEALADKLEKFHSVRVSGTGLRIVFQVEGQTLTEVYLDDYH